MSTYRTTTRTGRTGKTTRGMILTKAQIRKLQKTRQEVKQLHNNLETGLRKLGKRSASAKQVITALQGLNKIANRFAKNGLRTLRTVTKTANGKKRH